MEFDSSFLVMSFVSSEAYTAYIISIMLTMPRVLVCMYIVPIFNTNSLQGILRTAVALAIALPISVATYHQHEWVNNSFFHLVPILMKEAAIGLLIGGLLAIPFWIFESIAVVFDTQRGAMMGEQLNPETGAMTSLTAPFLQKALVVLMIEFGAFVAMFNVIIESYILWPAVSWIPQMAMDASTMLIAEFSRMVQQYVLYALPIIFGLLLIDLLFALVSVYSPQLQVYFIAMPVKSLVGMFIFVLCSAMLFQYGKEELYRIWELPNIMPLILKPFLGSP